MNPALLAAFPVAFPIFSGMALLLFPIRNQVYIANKPVQLKDGGRLADIAPTLLELINLPIPGEMTGESLIKTKNT